MIQVVISVLSLFSYCNCNELCHLCYVVGRFHFWMPATFVFLSLSRFVLYSVFLCSHCFCFWSHPFLFSLLPFQFFLLEFAVVKIIVISNMYAVVFLAFHLGSGSPIHSTYVVLPSCSLARRFFHLGLTGFSLFLLVQGFMDKQGPF